MKPSELPVYKQRSKILKALKNNKVIVVESPTGSGKTTQIPQILYQAGYAKKGIIGITQPRRIAAVSVAEYIAQNQGKTIPDLVGYKMRFEDNTGPQTKIKIMTDGTLLQEIKSDYYLSAYSVIIVDEAHERSLNIDFILGLLKRVIEERPDFKVIISSATINAEIFSVYFEDCPVVSIETAMFPVEIIYSPPQAEKGYDGILLEIQEIVNAVCVNREEGDFLIFLSGQKQIKDCISLLNILKERFALKILPLYARLSSQEQERVFLNYPGRRKVIVATNIAETSVTIDGITHVIDPGNAKMNYYNNRTFTSSLIEVPISRASANQRKGRAGRTRPGHCYRLYTKADFEHRTLYTKEEILRTDLSEVVLRMAEIGIKDFESFEFISPPAMGGVKSAVETLRMLGAIDKNRDLTGIGLKMIQFPMLPRHSRIIVEAILNYPDVMEEVIIAASFLTTSSPFLLPQGEEIAARKAHHNFQHPLGDFISYLKIFRAFTRSNDKMQFCERYYLDFKTMQEIKNVKSQLEEIVGDFKIPILGGGSIADYLCAIARGLIQFVCVKSKKGKQYRSLTAQKIEIHPGSVMFRLNPQYIVAGEIVKTSRMYARSVSVLKPEWLKRVSPTLLKELLAAYAGHKALKKDRDFTNQIKLGDQIFKIIKEKGKRIVILPWQKLKSAIKKINPEYLPPYKGLRGRIIYKQYEMLSNVRLGTIIRMASKLDPERSILYNWPAKRNFDYYTKARELYGYLDNLLLLCAKKKKKKRLGFLTLNTDGRGVYWFTCEWSFYNAIEESIASLERLADEPEDLLNKKELNNISNIYKKLTILLEG